MNIALKLEKLRQAVEAGTIRGKDLATAGQAAMMRGMQRPKGVVTPEWNALMNMVTTDPTELRRLNGLEDPFNETHWGLPCLAYIAGNSTCTTETAKKGGTLRSMSPDMIITLDLPAGDSTYKSQSTEDAYRRFLEAVAVTDKQESPSE